MTAIDLHSQSPLVLKQDFFDRPIPVDDSCRFDIVALSLVINFVDEPAKRGLMLTIAKHHIRLGGFLYIVLPLACVANSRYFSHDFFSSIIQSLNYSIVSHHFSKKLAYYLLRLESRDGSMKTFPKRELLAGSKRNNFCITLGPGF